MTYTIEHEKQYARLQNGRIVEFPVNNNTITEDELKTGEVVKVVDTGTKLVEDKFHKVTCVLTMVAGIPTYIYSIDLLTSDEFVQKNYIDVLKTYFHLPILNAATIPPAVVEKMIEAVKDLGTLELDRFAQSRGYDNIISLVSYRGDPSPRFAEEAERGMQLRSKYWSNLTEFKEQVVSGVVEFPRDVKGITDMFPTLTWN